MITSKCYVLHDSKYNKRRLIYLEQGPLPPKVMCYVQIDYN